MWQYECESCDNCGRCYNLVGYWDDNKWLSVNGQEGGCLCVECFLELADIKNINISSQDIERLWVFKERGASFDIVRRSA